MFRAEDEYEEEDGQRNMMRRLDKDGKKKHEHEEEHHHQSHDQGSYIVINGALRKTAVKRDPKGFCDIIFGRLFLQLLFIFCSF